MKMAQHWQNDYNDNPRDDETFSNTKTYSQDTQHPTGNVLPYPNLNGDTEVMWHTLI